MVSDDSVNTVAFKRQLIRQGDQADLIAGSFHRINAVIDRAAAEQRVSSGGASLQQVVAEGRIQNGVHRLARALQQVAPVIAGIPGLQFGQAVYTVTPACTAPFRQPVRATRDPFPSSGHVTAFFRYLDGQPACSPECPKTGAGTGFARQTAGNRSNRWTQHRRELDFKAVFNKYFFCIRRHLDCYERVAQGNEINNIWRSHEVNYFKSYALYFCNKKNFDYHSSRIA